MQALFLAGWAEASGALLTGSLFFPSESDRAAVDSATHGDGQGLQGGREPVGQRGSAAGGAGAAQNGSASEALDAAPPARMREGASGAAGETPSSATGGQRAPGAESVSAGLLYSRPVVGSTTAERFLAATLASAERTLYVTNSYFVPTPLLVHLLLDAAQRGVDVRILLPDEHTDIPMTRYAGRSFYQELMAAGIRIFEYQPSMMHAKTLVVDGKWTALGTLNFDNRSLRLNDESALVVHDEGLGALMDSLFLADVGRAQEITLESHGARPMRERLLEWLARRMAALL
jgi:phosphatidylserine/phosphatidylglycerophosphate/cardiolipin synthase-like enzyme